MSTSSQIPTGSIALRGEEEYLTFWIFEAAHEERILEGKGTLIMIMDPSNPSETPKTHDNVLEKRRFPIPKGHEVKVIDALVKMTK